MASSTVRYRHYLRDRVRELRVRLGLRRPIKIDTKDTQPRCSTEPSPIDSRHTHFGDCIRKGWFNNETQELYPGFAISRTDTILDMGCGTGGNLSFCAKFAAHSIGIDINPQCIEIAEARLREAGIASFQLLQSDGNPLPIPSNKADKIVCTEVFEHVDDPRIAIQELVRVGKPGCLYFLSVPGELSEQVLKELAPAACFEKPNHIRFFSKNDFHKLIEDSGLIVEKHEFFGFYGAVWHALIWKTGEDYDTGTHPVLEQWARTWETLMAMPEGAACMNALDRAFHKSQIIIARKPQN